MKLLLENWRGFLLNERLNYQDYYIEVSQHTSVYKPNYCEFDAEGDKECIPYGTIKDYGSIHLIRATDNEELMNLYLQSYTGYISHHEIKEYEDDCREEYDEAGGCVSKSIEIAGLRWAEEEIYSGPWNVENWLIPSKFARGALAVAFCETVIAFIRDKLGAQYFAYHQVVHPSATTSEQAQKLSNYAVKKGFLKDVLADFEPENVYPTDIEDYQVFKITDVAQEKFKINK